jgi:hypothetical protein
MPTQEATGLRLVRKRRPRKEPSRTISRSSVTVQDLIAAGILRPPLDLEREYKGHHLEARIETDGSVNWGGELFSSLSTAGGAARASVIGKKKDGRFPQTNGWTFWRYRDEGGKLHEVEALRKRLEAGSKRSAE